MKSFGPLALNDVRATIAFDQPKLLAVPNGNDIHITGSYLLTDGQAVSPAGPLAEFEIEMILSAQYPKKEPRVLEVGGRIPRHSNRHVNPNGDCCITVWEHWLASTEDHSLASYFIGPLHQFFLGQFWFERTGKWPFGEYTHGKRGLQEAYAEALGIANNENEILYRLRLLSQNWPKGHWLCPCGGGRQLRHCHWNDFIALHKKISPHLARRMLRRLEDPAR